MGNALIVFINGYGANGGSGGGNEVDVTTIVALGTLISILLNS